MRRAGIDIIWHYIVVMACCWLAGCNEHQEPVFADKTAQTNTKLSSHRDPSGRLIVKALEYGDSATLVNLTAIKIPEQFDTAKWQPLQVSDAFIVEPNALQTAVILPVVNKQTTLFFELELNQGDKIYRAVTQIVVLPLENNQRFGGVISQSPDGRWLIPVAFDTANSLFTVTAFIGVNPQGELATFDVTAQENILSISPSLLASCCDNLRIVKVHISHNGGPLITAWLLNPLANDVSGDGSSNSSVVNSFSSLVNSSLNAFSSLGISSVAAQPSSAAQIPSSAQSSAISSSVALQISSSVATSSTSSSGASSSNSVDFSSSSALMTSSSSGPSERELAVAAICADNWQGLASLPTAHVNYQTESPYVNAEPFIDPVYVQHIEQSQQLEAENAALVAAMEMLKAQPTGVWLDTAAGLCESVNGKPSLVEYLNLAEARNQLLTLVLYNIPARDCVRQERTGEFGVSEFGLEDYQFFVDRVSALATIYSNVPISMIVEPTAFASTVSNGGFLPTNCYDARQLQLHEKSLSYALKRFARNENIFSYLDYGDPSWPGSFNGDQALVDFIESTKLADGSLAIEGISLNVGSYVPLEEPFMVAQDNSGEPYVLPKGVHSVNAHVEYLQSYLQDYANIQLSVLVDTARNGWGGELRPRIPSVGQESRVDRRVGREAWCNALGAGLGEGFRLHGNSAYYWVDAPGFSDGYIRADCNVNFNNVVHMPKLPSPAAGEWFHEYFVDLINNAYPTLLNPVNNPDELPLLLRATPLRIPVQDVSHVNLNIALPEGVVFQSLAIKYASEEFALPEGWQGQNNVDMTMGSLSLTYFHDLLKITATGSDGQHYFGEAAVFGSPNFDGKPVMDIALGGRGFFPDFYGIYQADIPEYTYTNDGFEGDDFLWLSSNAPSANGGAGDDYLQVRSAFGGPGNDVLAAWGYASGGEGDDVFYAWDTNVTVEDTPSDFDVVHWLGRDFNAVDLGAEIELQINDEDLIMIESPNRGDKQATLLVKGFFANPPHINEIHYGDGQTLTPETAREMLGL